MGVISDKIEMIKKAPPVSSTSLTTNLKQILVISITFENYIFNNIILSMLSLTASS